MRKMIAIAATLAVVSTQFAYASSDAAWNALLAKANGSCIGQSRMDTPEASAPVVFDDSIGKVAVLLRGSIGKNKSKVNLLCLYDKKSGKASIEEFRWLGK
ncbi:hypothetical protein [Pararhizobium sp. PWRC1-1]|uniref:hypothetical protein n=1 Tax=Pararhizobium sp. PWRC1-1 TaxID=2804566 RepID=UPI003CF72211